MKVVSTFKHVYADFALIQDGDQYYHCFFDRPNAEEYKRGSCLIDTISPITKEEADAYNAHSSDSWRTMTNIYNNVDVEYWMVGELFYENREMTVTQWEALCREPAVFLMLAALT